MNDWNIRNVKRNIKKQKNKKLKTKYEQKLIKPQKVKVDK